MSKQSNMLSCQKACIYKITLYNCTPSSFRYSPGIDRHRTAKRDICCHSVYPFHVHCVIPQILIDNLDMMQREYPLLAA